MFFRQGLMSLPFLFYSLKHVKCRLENDCSL